MQYEEDASCFVFQNSMFFQVCWKKKNGVQNFHTFVYMFFTECSHIFDPILYSLLSLFLFLCFSLALHAKYYDKWSRIECSESKQMRVPLPPSDKNYFNDNWSTCCCVRRRKTRKRGERVAIYQVWTYKFGKTSIINYFQRFIV